MRGLTRRRAAVTGAVVVTLAVVGAWNQRRTLAEGAIARELASRGVKATYRVAGIGLRWERLEKIVIGDPGHPDMTADWAEVHIAATLGGLRATAIRAGGVRLRARLLNGTISFGDVDKLLPAPSGAPFTLPDLSVDLTDGRISLGTPFGEVGARLDGSGNLANGFRGKLAAVAPKLAIGGCRADHSTMYVDLAISRREPSITGPVRAAAISCGNVRFDQPAFGVDVVLSEAFDRWRGSSALGLKAMATGSQRLADISGRITITGSAVETLGTAQATAKSGSIRSTQVDGLSLDGKFSVRPASFGGQGTVKAAHLAIDPHYAAQLNDLALAAAGTPVGPLLGRLAHAAADAGAEMSASAEMAVNDGSAIVRSADLTTTHNMRLHVGGGQGVRLGADGLSADTQATLVGGGFPTLAAVFRRSTNGETNGVVRIAPYFATNARVSLAPVQFALRRNGTGQAVTTAVLDGPLGNGRVDGLRLPVILAFDRSGSVAFNPGCTDAGFNALAISNLRLGPASLRFCATSDALLTMGGGGVGGGATIISPRLSGRLGSAPLSIDAGRAEVALSGNRFAIGKLDVKLGNADRLTVLNLGTIDGRFEGGSLAGKFGDLAGKIGNVPLLIDSGDGTWSLDRGVLALTGKARVSDEARPVRFNTLLSEDVRLRLASGKIEVIGMLREPSTSADVAAVTIRHDLGSGAGRANLEVAGLQFGSALQPEKLTPLTIGVVANVQGKLSGTGQIDWSSAGVTSTGHFATKGMDFAAAFGPVSGLSGKIVFTDLLGMVTAPGQVASIGVVNPGIPVPDGRVTYHLAAGQKIVVEGGNWPFAGGALILDPTTLDMGVSRERRLTFRVEGLDAAKFIQQLEFENLAATGTFDGSMPMIFDDTGGRIVGGKIVARPGGGTLSYVGEVSNAKLNAFAKLAFDALKSIRYNNLAIGMDGALDGEIVSTVNFRGVNQAPTAKKRGYFARQFANLPFIFNITIRAPFRGLLSTARTFQDPSALLKELPRPAPIPPTIIQAPESEKRP